MRDARRQAFKLGACVKGVKNEQTNHDKNRELTYVAYI